MSISSSKSILEREASCVLSVVHREGSMESEQRGRKYLITIDALICLIGTRHNTPMCTLFTGASTQWLAAKQPKESS